MTKLVVHQFQESSIEQRSDDGYFNLTAMCTAANKFVADYLRLDSTKAYLEALSTDTGIPVGSLVEIFKGGSGIQGTWAHPEVAVDCGKWCSIQMRIAVNRWFVGWAMKAQQPKSVYQFPETQKEEYRRRREENKTEWMAERYKIKIELVEAQNEKLLNSGKAS